MQYPFNWLALGIVRDGLRESCVVHIEDKVLPEVSSVDAWVEPRAGRMPREDDDWLTRMGYEPSEIEPFHLGPTLGEHNDSIMKVMALHARERRREGREAPAAPDAAALVRVLAAPAGAHRALDDGLDDEAWVADGLLRERGARGAARGVIERAAAGAGHAAAPPDGVGGDAQGGGA